MNGIVMALAVGSLAGLIASLAVIAIMVLASAKRRHNDSGSVRTFSLDDDLNTETASRYFGSGAPCHVPPSVLLVMARGAGDSAGGTPQHRG